MAKVTFYSNYLNHYQLPLSKKLHQLTNGNFYFVSQKAISEKRISFGFRNLSDENDFVIKTYESESEIIKANELSLSSDYVIFGGNSKIDKYVFDRIKNNRITFEYSERLNKRKPSLLLWVKKYINMFFNRTIYKKNKLFLLCNGTYVASDFNEFNMYQNKSYKWGYFPEFTKYDVDELMNNKDKNPITLIWAGRLIQWKHPELVIKLAKKLKNNNYSFNILIVGNGEMEDMLKEEIARENLSDCVHMLGSMPPDKVRENMIKASIYLFTSDYQEGWGVVLNEAMNSCCACVASHAAGSTGYLLRNNENGLIYESENFNDFFDKVKLLMDNEEIRNKLSINAYNTIKDMWNADVAAERFMILAEKLDKGEDTPFVDGPCSKAEIIKNKDSYKYLTK